MSTCDSSFDASRPRDLYLVVSVDCEAPQRPARMLQLKASYTSSLRPHTLVAYDLIHLSALTARLLSEINVSICTFVPVKLVN
jgi:hypothetical protein